MGVSFAMLSPAALTAVRANRPILTLVTHLAGGGLLLAAIANATGAMLPLPSGYLPLSLGLYGILLALLLTAAGTAPPYHFGTANRITLLRAILVCLIGGVVIQTSHTTTIIWLTVATAAVAEILDGLDGWAARRKGLSSAFGARFDVETDSLFILLLAVLIWRFEKTGAWILVIGMMRYGFLLAGLFLAALRRPLPPSKRRQSICVAQAVLLTVCLTPLVTPAMAGFIAAAALAVLTWSFAVDIVWLLRATPAEGEPQC